MFKKNQWGPLLNYSARGYTFYLYHHYFLKDQDFENSRVQETWKGWLDLGFNLGQELTAATPRQKFSIRDLTKIARHLERLEMMPFDLDRDSLKLVIELAVNRLLVEPSRRLKGYEPDALTPDSFDVLRSEYYIWQETNSWLKAVSRNGISPRELYRKIREARQDDNSPLKAARAKGLEEFALSVDSKVQMVFDRKERLILTNGALPKYDSKSLELLNLQRTASRLLLRSFVGDTRRIQNYQGATLKEMENAFAVIRPLMVNLNLIDSSSTGFAASRFREANMFTPHGNGDSYLSHAELTDLAGLIWSGLKIHNLFKSDLAKTCLKGRWNGSSKTQLHLGCALRVYYDKAKSAMSSAAIFVKYTEIAPVDRWNDYMINITKAAGYVPNQQNLITFGDLSLVPHVLQYVEMIYMRFDPDKNGVLNTQESYEAYPAFKGILYELAKDQLKDGTLKEEHLMDLFGYILRYGKPPETVPEKLHFVTTWRGRPGSWNIQADRNKLATILGYIADQIAARKK